MHFSHQTKLSGDLTLLCHLREHDKTSDSFIWPNGITYKTELYCQSLPIEEQNIYTFIFL